MLVIAPSSWCGSTLPSPRDWYRQWQESGLLSLIKINRWLSTWGNSNILPTLFLHCICAGLTFCLCPFYQSPDFMVARGTEEGGWASAMGILWAESSCVLSFLHYFPNLPLWILFLGSKSLCEQECSSLELKKWTKDLKRHFSKEDFKITQKHTRRCTASLIMRETQIKTSGSCNFSPTGCWQFKEWTITSVGEHAGKLESSFIVSVCLVVSDSSWPQGQ